MEFANNVNRRVLIVDDQDDIHNDFVEMLQSRFSSSQTDDLAKAFIEDEEDFQMPEFELVHASSGEAACEIIEEGRESNAPVCVAFVDIRMPPGIDGIETIRRVRKIDHEIELVIMTAYTDKALPEILRNMELLNKLLYIRKPFAREEIQQITISLVEKWNVERQLAEKQEQLTASYQRLRAVLDAVEDPMAMWDDHGDVLYANHAYENLFDLPRSALEKISLAAFKSQFEKRFRKLELTDAEGGILFQDEGIMIEEITNKPSAGQRLFYRFVRNVVDDNQNVLGDLYVYRDVSKEVEVKRMKAEVFRLRSELETTYSFTNLVGASDQMQRVYSLMKQAASSDITVLIQGESGTGKELVARSIHFHSSRKNRPFLAINCAAIPETLIESELFGHEQGAFTGAIKQKTGVFEHAREGTILLDEIGDMPALLQAKLLRVLQERKIQRVGGIDFIPIDIRVIVATNKNLELAIEKGEFRKDLYYRISAFPISIPPLRERREDIPSLVKHFLGKHTVSIGKSINSLSTAALQRLLQYDWPGNVRELENAIERAILLETEQTLQADNLLPQFLPVVSRKERPAARKSVNSLEEVEGQTLLQALEFSANNISKAARFLGINRSTLYRKLKKYNLPAKD